MKLILIGATIALTLTGRALAQTRLKPGTPGLLVWRGEDQATGYRTIEKVYRVRTIKRGTTVHPLPVEEHQIAPTFTYQDKTWTVDDYMAAYRVSGLLVLKDGRIVLERYGLGRKSTDRWISFSVAKSITSMLVGAAIQDGKIKSLNAPVTDYVKELRGSAYEGVTVGQMLQMSSGVKWNEDYANPNSDVAKAGTQILTVGVDPIVSYLAKLPRAHEPGTTFNYNTGETDLVGILVSNAVGMPLAEYASQKIWKPYGMERDAVWMTDVGGRERGGCCISMRLRDYARFGQFVLDGGKVAGRQIVPLDWTKEATRVHISDGVPVSYGDGYGYFWWIRQSGAYDALGIFGQSITTFPDDRLIVVQNAAWPAAVGQELFAALNAFIEAVRKATDKQTQNPSHSNTENEKLR